jgi:hypothetical protein
MRSPGATIDQMDSDPVAAWTSESSKISGKKDVKRPWQWTATITTQRAVRIWFHTGYGIVPETDERR